MSELLTLFSQYGLVGILTGVLVAILFLVIKSMISSHKTDMKNMIDLVKKRDVTIDNHIDHLTEAVGEQSKAIIVSSQAMESSVDKLIIEQRHSTDMVKQFLKDK